MPLPTGYNTGDPLPAADINAITTAINGLDTAVNGLDALTKVYIQQTDPGGTGPAIWYVTNAAGEIIGKKVRAS